MAFLDESAEWAESIDDERLQYRAEIANRELSFATGARFSLAVFNLTAFGGIFVGKGLYALFGSRRERLLIELNARIHDRSTEVDT